MWVSLDGVEQPDGVCPKDHRRRFDNGMHRHDCSFLRTSLAMSDFDSSFGLEWVLTVNVLRIFTCFRRMERPCGQYGYSEYLRNFS